MVADTKTAARNFFRAMKKMPGMIEQSREELRAGKGTTDVAEDGWKSLEEERRAETIEIGGGGIGAQDITGNVATHSK